MSGTPGKSPEELKLEELTLVVQKLQLEVETMRFSGFWDRMVGRYLPLVTAILAVTGFWVGLWQYYDGRAAADDRAKIEAKVRSDERDRLDKERADEVARAEEQRASDLVAAQDRRTEELTREAARPFWETQLRLYLRASEAAAVLANSTDEAELTRARTEFNVLYWGPLAVVEDVGIDADDSTKTVESQMVAFGGQLTSDAKDRSKLRRLSLELAHAMRTKLTPAFKLKIETTDPGKARAKQPSAD